MKFHTQFIGIVFFAMPMHQEAFSMEKSHIDTLNIEDALNEVQSGLCVSASSPSLKLLSVILKQYHPDNNGDITGKNFQKLCRMLEKACPYWGPGTLFRQILEHLCWFIKNHKVQQSATCLSCNQYAHCALQLSCEHVFCYACLYQYQSEETDRNTCPSCSNPIDFVIENSLNRNSFHVSEIINTLKNSSSTINEIMKCLICYEIATAPLIIDCGHVLCYECLFEWYARNKEDKENRNNDYHLLCPLCRQPFSDLIQKSFQKNFSYNTIHRRSLALDRLERESRELFSIEYNLNNS